VADPADTHVVTVEVFGQRFAIRSALEPDYVAELAAYVTEKMKAASLATPNSDLLRVAVLTALNLADEIFRCRHAEQWRAAEVSERAAALEQLLDQALR
jgi:cell division protein ZapA